VLLPFVLIFMLLLVNKPDIMGRLINWRAYNVVAWGLTGAITLITMLMLYSQFRGF
jgi:Mn2+/Fe2+ NRAMP family transporter